MKFGLRRLHAFSLVEVTLALGIAAFCLIAVFGLVPVGVQTNRNATSQTTATNILSSVVSDIRASPKGRQPTAKYKIRRAKGNQTTVCFDGQGQPDGAGQIGNVPCRAGNWRYRLYVKIYPTATLPFELYSVLCELCGSETGLACCSRSLSTRNAQWLGGNGHLFL